MCIIPFIILDKIYYTADLIFLVDLILEFNYFILYACFYLIFKNNIIGVFMCLFKYLILIHFKYGSKTLCYDLPALFVILLEICRSKHYIPYCNALGKYIAVFIKNTASLCRNRGIVQLLFYSSLLQLLSLIYLKVKKPCNNCSEAKNKYYDHKDGRSCP